MFGSPNNLCLRVLTPGNPTVGDLAVGDLAVGDLAVASPSALPSPVGECGDE
jgi:hypothetical protein